MDYKIQIRDLSGNVLGEIENANKINFSNILNREGDASFTLSLKDSKIIGYENIPNSDNTSTVKLTTTNLIEVGQREVYIYRDTDIVWAGYIILIDGTLEKNSDIITIHCKGFLELLKTRYTGASRYFDTVDAGLIAQTLVSESQALTDGDLGITNGVYTASRDITVLYEYMSLYDAIKNLGEVEDGFDFSIGVDKKLNIYAPKKGTDLSDTKILEWGKNIDKVSLIHDFTEPANYITMLGAGNGTAMVTVTRIDTIMRASYKLKQLIYPSKNENNADRLSDQGDKLLKEKAFVVRQYQVSQLADSSPYLGEIVVGDWIKLRIDYGYLQVSDVVRVAQINADIIGNKEIVNYLFQYI